jgi:sulfoxide reductase heme-binding subunit YedZ
VLELFSPKAPLPWLKPGVFVGALVPIPVIVWRGTHGQLGADIIATVLKIVTGWSWGIRLRRMLGLFAFFYASLHFLTYFVVDHALNLQIVVEDITKRKFILVGFLTLVLMTPLAITSTNKMVRRMGFVRWKRLHRLAYVAGCLGVIHFIWRVKADVREPLIFAGILGAAFALRLLDVLRTRTQKKAAKAAAGAA